jgi:AcrR family transcriptional regulator
VLLVTTAKRKRMPRAERERQMIEVAERVFTERGYASASMDEIAELVGVSKPMLYEYFRGLLAFFVFIRERREAWSLLRHEMALIGTPAADEIEQTRRQQTDLIAALMSGYFDSEDELRAEASAEFVVGACERLAIWCERFPEVTPEMATGYAMDMLWSGLSRSTR